MASLSIPAGAQRLRSPAASLVLAPASVTCGASPRVNLSWTDSASTATATYRVMTNTATGKASAWSAGAYLGNVRSTSVGAANGTSWKFAIEALTNVTRDSNVVAITINCPAVDTIAPTVPSITSAVVSSCSAITLSWTISTDTGGSGLAGYNVWRNNTFVQRVAAPTTTDVDTGLASSTSYSYQVSALDNAGNQSARSTAAVVSTPSCSNLAPSASAGPDQSVQTYDQVSFDGSGSSDPDGTIVNYTWSFGDPSAPAYGAAVGHAYTSSGSYTVTLTVTDNQGATAQDTANVTVANRAPFANAGPDQSSVAGSAVAFNGSNSFDIDGTISGYTWNFGDGSPAADGASVSHAYAVAGVYTATLSVLDNQGAIAQDTAVITVGDAPNQPPLASAGADKSALTLVAITFNGSGSSDPDGTISSYGWSFGDGTTGSGSSPSHAYASAGTYTVTLTVTDNDGATATDTATATITNRPPVAKAGPDQSAVAGAVVGFDGSASSDPDGIIGSYTWNFGDGTTATGATPSHTYPNPGTYTATLTVTDDDGASASDGLVVTVASPTPSLWATPIGGVSSDSVTAVDTDVNGNVYVTGTFGNIITIGPFTLTSAGGADVFLAKYSPGGQPLWARRMGSLSSELSSGIAVDGSGHVDIVGQYFDTADFGGPQPLVSTRNAGGGPTQNLFVAQYSTLDGAYQWAKSFGGPNTASASAVAVDAAGNIYATGFFVGSINFGGSTLDTPTATDRDSFVVKLTASAAHVWSKHFTSNSDDQGASIAVDGSGNVAVAGWFLNGLNLGGANMTALNSMTDVYVGKFDNTGKHVWSKKLGSDSGNEDARGIVFDPSGNVVVVGTAISPVDFGGGLLSSGGYGYGYVAKYGAAAGAYMWANKVGGPSGADYANAVDVDASGNVLVAGAFESSTVDFAGGQQLARIGMSDGYVAKFGSNGALSWARAYGGASIDVLKTVNAAPGGNPVTGGYFNGSATMEDTALTSAGLTDGVVIRTSP